ERVMGGARGAREGIEDPGSAAAPAFGGAITPRNPAHQNKWPRRRRGRDARLNRAALREQCGFFVAEGHVSEPCNWRRVLRPGASSDGCPDVARVPADPRSGIPREAAQSRHKVTTPARD